MAASIRNFTFKPEMQKIILGQRAQITSAVRKWKNRNIPLSSHCFLVHSDRCSTSSSQDAEYKVKPPLKPRRYALDKLVSFITTYSEKLENRIPKVFQVYRTFRTGVSCFVADTKKYYKVSLRMWEGQTLVEFTREELELYRQFSSDLPRVGIIMVIAFAPGGVSVFPLAYLFPRFFLSHHFWTPQQKEDFRMIQVTKQLRHLDSILDYMHVLSRHVEDSAAETAVKQIIKKLDLCAHLTNEEILSIVPLFEGRPYRIDSISIRHMRHLGKSLGLSLGRRRLVKDALLLHHTDLAIIREGLDSASDEDLDTACAWRGLNSRGLKRKEKVSYLERWTDISSHINARTRTYHYGYGYSRPANFRKSKIGNFEESSSQEETKCDP